MTDYTSKIDLIYDYIFDEADTRVCKDIPDEACKVVPHNFFKITLTQTFTKFADELANIKTVIPWLIGALGASPFWIGFLVPIRESFSMLPQLFIADFIRKISKRKNIWLVGAVLQSLALFGIVLVTLSLTGNIAGGIIIGLILIFSLARGLVSISSKDVIGKTIPKTRRDRLTGFTVGFAGLLTLIIGGVIFSGVGKETDLTIFIYLVSGAAGLWLIAAGIFSTVKETSGATEGGKRAIKEAFSKLELLKTDIPFRNFVIVRALFIATALAGPYYISLAQMSGGEGELLGIFVFASGLASALSSFFWGKYADRSSKFVLVTAVSIASTLGIILFVLDSTGILSSSFSWIIPITFFILAIAHSGVRIGRKTYILDLAGGKKRTDYVAVSNTVIGLILLLSGSLGSLVPLIGVSGMLLLFSIIGFSGVFLALKLPDVQ